jgi:eukaryotic-like serine/threonine-protein kinase
MVRLAFCSRTKGRMTEARRTVLDDRYDVVRPLGSGGMGEVFLARDRVLGRDVALKVLRKQFAGDEEFAERFKREAMSAASLSHPNIVQVYDRGETEEGDSYIAMEYVPGGTLKERISGDGPLGAADAASLGAQVAEALGAAHDRGMVHRDIKPQNVLLTASGGAKVADFGIARAGSSATISRTGSVMGTAGYMSPEQALGKPATPKSDLYSLGVVLYEALTGELPFTADNPIAVSMKHVNEPLRPPIELNPGIPEGMNALVTKLMSKDPGDRYADADELADDLWRVKRGLAPVAARVGTMQRPRAQRTAVASPSTTYEMPKTRPAPRRRRRGFPWLLIALAAILFTLGVLGGLRAVVGPDAMNGWFDAFQNDSQPPAQPDGPEQIRVPKLAGLTQNVAVHRLEVAGLEVGQVSSFPSDSVAEGRVIEPGIDAGTPVEPGTGVNLTISSGPQPSSSASSSASAQSSPEPAASSASSASAQPAPREERRTVERPAARENVPKAKVPKTKVQKSPPAQRPDVATPAREPGDDSGGQGRGRGRGGESGED